MPTPESWTTKVTCSRSGRADTVTVTMPWWVNFSALWIRLRSRICSLLGSVRIGGRPGSTRQLSSTAGLRQAGGICTCSCSNELRDRDVAQVDGHQTALEPAHVERRLDQLEQLQRLLPHRAQRLAMVLGQVAEGALELQVGVADDDVQRRAQLVRHRRHELFLELVGGLQIGDQVGVVERRRGVHGDTGEDARVAQVEWRLAVGTGGEQQAAQLVAALQPHARGGRSPSSAAAGRAASARARCSGPSCTTSPEVGGPRVGSVSGRTSTWRSSLPRQRVRAVDRTDAEGLDRLVPEQQDGADRAQLAAGAAHDLVGNRARIERGGDAVGDLEHGRRRPRWIP